MKKILVVAYVFPPIAYAGTHRTLRLCKHLAGMGYDIDVLTIAVQDDLHNDINLLRSIQQDVRIIRTPMLDPYRFHRKSNAVLGQSFMGKIGAAIIGRAAEFISKPDHMVYWLLSATRPALKMIRDNRYDLLYTTSPPHSEQILGYLLKKAQPRLRWVADMRDPILDNLIMDKMDVLNKNIHRWLETRVAETADAVIFNTQYAAESFEQRYQNGKSHLIRNSYDEKSFAIEAPDSYDRFTLAHVGSIYAFRNVDPLFTAVSRLVDRGGISAERFRLLFVGMNDGSIGEKARKLGIENLVEIQGMVPHQQAIETMLRSHLLLLVKGLGPNSGSQIPGKLYEYLATGRPILHIGPTQSEASDIIAAEQAGCTFNDDVEALADYIQEKYRHFIDTTAGEATPRPDRQNFSSLCMAQRMRELFVSLEHA